ncbi:MAG: hypothetical protein ABI857_04150 [Acidobacteriota bacterium]
MVRLLLFCLLLSLTPLGVFPQTDAAIKQRFKSKNYTVTWGNRPSYPADSELVIGYGSGHGGSLGWLRFRPIEGGVEVLSIELDPGWHPSKSKWSPDVVPVAVKRGPMAKQAYASLLHDLAIVKSGRLKAIQRNSVSMSSANFWVASRLVFRDRTLLNWNWAGYAGSFDEIEYAKPNAAVDLARAKIAKLPLKEHSLSVEERRWASAKFIEDWNELSAREFYWWVAERLIMLSGQTGDFTVLPKLREIMSGPLTGSPSDRRVYYAINAITRITGKDVRPKPVEEMDLESTRRRVLDTLSEMEK